jgi:hypothetical protein
LLKARSDIGSASSIADQVEALDDDVPSRDVLKGTIGDLKTEVQAKQPDSSRISELVIKGMGTAAAALGTGMGHEM